MSKSMQKPAVGVESSPRGQPSHETIARRAYRIWEEHGRPTGTSEQDWYQAAGELRAKRWFRHGAREH